MNPLTFVLAAVLVWVLLSWVCGIALGAMIKLMEGEDEFEFEFEFEDLWRVSA